MKKIKRIITLVLAVSICFCICFSGCTMETATPTSPINIVFVVGVADGEARLTDIRELSTLPAQPGSDYAFISLEAKPACIGKTGTIADLSDRGYTSEMMERVRKSIRAELNARISDFTPSTGEIDLATATSYAVRILNAHAVPGRRNILVYYASGRSSCGLINLVNTPIYKLDIDASVPRIAEQMQVDMSSVDEVVWYACGDCGGESQPALSTDEQAKMQEFYGKLFKALGFKNDISFQYDLPDSGFYYFPQTPVTSMDVRPVFSGLQELVEATPTVLEKNEVPGPIVLDDSQVQFKPDSDVFLDSDQAESAIQPVADYLIRNKSLSVLLYATCAGDSDSETAMNLASDRASRVKQSLIGKGVDETRITVIPVSIYDDPYYKFGLGTGKEAAVNRKCIIMDIESSTAQVLLSRLKP